MKDEVKIEALRNKFIQKKRDEARKEGNNLFWNDVFAYEGSFDDEYVEWLESLIIEHEDTIRQLHSRLEDACRIKE